jgi:hypothetical protein
MKFKVLLAAALAVAVSAPALADDKDSDKGNGNGTAAPAQKEKKICRNETVTGSLVAKRRICMTAAEWNELASKSKQNIDNFTKDAALPQQGANPVGG